MTSPASDKKTLIEEHVSTMLNRHPHLQRRRVRVEAHQGRLVLRGVVGSFYEKQLAQESLRQVEGVDQIENELEVAWS